MTAGSGQRGKRDMYSLLRRHKQARAGAQPFRESFHATARVLLASLALAGCGSLFQLPGASQPADGTSATAQLTAESLGDGSLLLQEVAPPTVAGSPLEIGNWVIDESRDTQTNRFSGCYATAKYRGGLVLMFAMPPAGLLVLSLIHPNLTRLQPDISDIMVAIDKGVSQVAKTSINNESHQLMILLGDIPNSYDRLRKAKQVRVTSNGHNFLFALTDISKVLPALTKCVADRTVGVANPFVAPRP